MIAVDFRERSLSVNCCSVDAPPEDAHSSTAAIERNVFITACTSEQSGRQCKYLKQRSVVRGSRVRMYPSDTIFDPFPPNLGHTCLSATTHAQRARDTLICDVLH